MNLKFARRQLSRRLTFRGLPISVETDKGELRHWFDPHENKRGTTKMRVPYGYIRRTEGVDGDHVDCYVGPNTRAPNVYVVHQMKAPDFKVYDEDKCMLGFMSADAAKSAYLAHYNKPGFFGSMTTMPFEEFEKKVKATFETPKKIAEEAMSSTYLKYARDLGARMAFEEFRKQADAALGDPNYWSGGSQAQQAPPQPASAEEAIQLLPGGTFQGLQMKITPDGQRSTTVKVTPEATQDPTGLNSIFAAEPGAKVEVSNPEEAVPGTQVASPGGPESGGMPPEGTMPPEGAMPPKLGVARIKTADAGALMRDVPETNNLAWRLQQVLKNISPAKGVTRPY